MIEWSNIRGCGSLAVINNMTNERLMNRVLRNTMKEFARHNVKLYSLIDDWIFHRNEREYTSAMLPALLSECECVLVEQAIARKFRGYDAGLGRMDYWAQYNSKTILLIELKQSYLSGKTCKVNKDFYLKWQALNQQLRSIKKKEIWDNLSTKKSSDIYKIGIESAYVYSRTKKAEKCFVGREDVVELITAINNDRKINADWIGCWYTPDLPKEDTAYNSHFHFPACIWVVKGERLKWQM